MATKRKLVVVHDNVILHELGNIGGPIINPTMLPIVHIQKLVMNNRAVYECDPKDPRNEKKRIRLTFSNFMKNNFEKKAADSNAKMVEKPKDANDLNTEKMVEKNQDNSKKTSNEAPVNSNPQATVDTVNETKNKNTETATSVQNQAASPNTNASKQEKK